MKLLHNRDEKVIVTRGYLMAFGGMLMMMAGLGLGQSSLVPQWVGLPFLILGLAILLFCFPHLTRGKPRPLDDLEHEAEG